MTTQSNELKSLDNFSLSCLQKQKTEDRTYIYIDIIQKECVQFMNILKLRFCYCPPKLIPSVLSKLTHAIIIFYHNWISNPSKFFISKSDKYWIFFCSNIDEWLTTVSSTFYKTLLELIQTLLNYLPGLDFFEVFFFWNLHNSSL